MVDETYNLILNTQNNNFFDLELLSDVFLDFENKGSSSKGKVTDNLAFYYDFNLYNDINNIYSLVNYDKPITSGFTIYDIGLTGIDTGYVNSITGQTISFFTGSTLTIKPVTGLTNTYPLSLVTDTTTNTKVLQSDGGFYQGFYKLNGFPYEIIPNRTQKGFTLNFWLNKTTGATSSNQLISDNFFFFMGTRAENKFHSAFSGETGITTSTGVLLNSQSGVTTNVNGIGFYYNDYEIGFKQIINRQDESGNTSVSIYNTGKTINVNNENPWINLCITFERQQYLTICPDCNCLIPEPIIPIEYTSGCTQEIPQTQKGILKFYYNARPIFSVQIEEPIFTGLTGVDITAQEGVPYNISIGGGTQGLLETQTFNGENVSNQNLFMYENFGGYFKGKISIASMYTVPLSVPEIIKNFNDLKSIYDIRETFGGNHIIINKNFTK